MRIFKNTYLSQLMVSLLAVLLFSCIDEVDNRVDAPIVGVGDRVPDFTVIAFDGISISTSSLSGQVYILNFFDTGCPDCRQELDVLQQIYDTYQERVPVLNVPRSQTRQQVQSYWDEHGLTLPFYMPVDPNLYYKFAPRIIPRTYVVAPSGHVRGAFSDSPVASFDELDVLLQ